MKNKISWNNFADKYSASVHSDKVMNALIKDPASAFHATTWQMIKTFVPDVQDKQICIPSSGDNHAVYAFAMLGARVTSCDISENQLTNAERIAKKYGYADNVKFICSDTMRLDEIPNNAYDLVYTSNGVHVWINDLKSMYRNIHRITKPGGMYIMSEIHPFQRPFDDNAKVVKPYTDIGPFEDETDINFHWRLMDIVNAIVSSGLNLLHIEEMPAEKDYEWPFWISLEDHIKGVTATKEEVDQMHDWQHYPMAALPNWLGLAARKE